MANEEYQIPIFLINGQLDSGKTRFISDTIAMGPVSYTHLTLPTTSRV